LLQRSRLFCGDGTHVAIKAWKRFYKKWSGRRKRGTRRKRELAGGVDPARAFRHGSALVLMRDKILKSYQSVCDNKVHATAEQKKLAAPLLARL